MFLSTSRIFMEMNEVNNYYTVPFRNTFGWVRWPEQESGTHFEGVIHSKRKAAGGHHLQL